jgi:uncharacterized protein
MENPTFENNSSKQRYEALREGQVIAYSEYRPIGESIMLTHTEVDEALEGQGVGSGLVRFALEDIRSKTLSAIPLCPFVKLFIKRHPEYIDTVHPEHRHAFGL